MYQITSLLFAFFGLLSTTSGTTYYFSTSGNDNYDGLSLSSPKKSVQVAVGLMNPGNTILFKRGDAWYYTGYELNINNKVGTSTNQILLDAYGSGRKPIIADMELMTSGWENGGTNLIKHTLTGYTDAFHCYVNGKSKLKTDLTSLNASTMFSISAGFIYLYGTSAPDTVEVEPDDGRCIVAGSNVSWVTIRNIDFRGGGNWVAIRLTSPSDHFTIDSCSVTEFSSYGIRLDVSSNTSYFHNAPRILNCYINKVWSLAENKTSASPGGDLIDFEYAVEGALVKGNTVIDFGHVGISLLGADPGYRGCNNNIIEQNESDLIYSNYGHAFAIGGVEGRCTNNIIRRNYFHDYKTTCHIEGDHNLVYSNLFVNVDVSPTPTKQGWAFDLCPWQIAWNNLNMACHDNMVVNNTIYDCEENPAYIHQFSPAFLGSNNQIKNNLIVKWNTTDHSANTNYGIMITPQASYAPIIQNNGFWNGSSTTKILSQAGTAYSANESSSLSNAKSNLQLKPVFIDEANRNFRLATGSPYCTGGQVLTNMGTGFVDFDGHPWSTKSPSIGAFQSADSISGVTDKHFNDALNVYPNPATDKIMISGERGGAEIITLSGTRIWNGVIDSEHEIDISSLRPGLYIFKTRNSIKKFIKLM